MTLWIMPEFDREMRAVCQFWLQGGKPLPQIKPTRDKGRQITLAKQARGDTTPPAATSGPVSINCQPVGRGP